MIAKFFKNSDDSPVAIVQQASALPSGLVVAPGHYTVSGVTYDCTREGLYRFWEPAANTEHRIVYSSDVDALISAFSWVCAVGRSDEGLSASDLTLRARNSRLRLRCGKTVDWIKACADSVGLQNRICRTMTAGTPNNVYDGHVLLEMKVNGVWTLYDPTYKSKFGIPLKDAVPLTPSVTGFPLADYRCAAEPFEVGQFDVSEWNDFEMRTPEKRRSELARLLQIPGIDHTDGLTYFYMPPGTEGRQSWLLSQSTNYRVITQSAWLTQFYP